MERFFEEIRSNIDYFFVWVVNYFLLIWAHFPVLSLTSDISFPNLSIKLEDRRVKLEEKDVRLSLISIYFGEYIFHLISFNISAKQFSLLKVLSLAKHPDFNDDIIEKEIEEKVAEYKKEIEKSESSDLEIEKDELLRKIENNNSRIEKSVIKINFFLAIILAIITLIGFNKIKEITFTLSAKNVLIWFLLYFTINLCALLIQSMKVRSYKNTCFEDLRKADDKNFLHLEQLYGEFQYYCRKADFFVSFIHRIYDYVKIVIAIGLSLVIVFMIEPKKEGSILQDYQLVILNNKQCYMNYTEDNIMLSELLIELKKNHYSRVIIMTKIEAESNLYDIFDVYNKQKISYIIDETLSESDIKIILEN